MRGAILYLKMMDFVLKMMDFAFKMMSFAFKMKNFGEAAAEGKEWLATWGPPVSLIHVVCPLV